MKRNFWFIGIFVLVFAMAAAGIAAHHAAGNGTIPDQPEAVQDEERAEAGEKTGTETAVEGIYVGLADNHTVEITVAGVPMAFGLGEGVAAGGLQEGERVSLEYIEDENGRLVLTSLVKIGEKESGTKKDHGNGVEETAKENKIYESEGILTGRIDNHSVEIEVEGLPKAFALNEALQAQEFAKGPITFKYYVDKNGRSIITEADFQEPRQTEVHTAEGIFQGLADNHTAEIEINGEYRSFALDADISFAGFDEGEKIFIAYQENEQGRQEIIKIEKIF